MGRTFTFVLAIRHEKEVDRVSATQVIWDRFERRSGWVGNMDPETPTNNHAEAFEGTTAYLDYDGDRPICLGLVWKTNKGEQRFFCSDYPRNALG